MLMGFQEFILSWFTTIAKTMTRPLIISFSNQNEGYYFSNTSKICVDITYMEKKILRKRHAKWENVPTDYFLK